MSLTKKFGIIFIVIAGALAVLLWDVTFGFGHASGEPEKKAPAVATQTVDLTGVWNRVGGNDGKEFAATIADDTIEIQLTVKGEPPLTGEYWSGSFKVDEKTSVPISIVSEGDTKKMKSELLASQDPTKNFQYKDGLLSFQFTMLGDTTTILLSK